MDALLKNWKDFPLDYKKFTDKLCKITQTNLLRIYYYNCLPIIRKMYETECYECKEKCEIHFQPDNDLKIFCEECLRKKNMKINSIKYDEETTKKDEKLFRNKKSFYNKLKRFPRFEIKYGRLQIIKDEFKQKGVDVLMSLNIADKCFENQIQHAIIVAGDSDFIPAIRRAKNYGAIVHLFCNKKKINRELLDEVDEIHELNYSFVEKLKQ